MVYKSPWFKSSSFVGFLTGCGCVLVICIAGMFFPSPAVIAPVCIFAAYTIRTFKDCRFLEFKNECLILKNRILPELKTEIAAGDIKSFLLIPPRRSGALTLYITVRNGKRKKFVLGCVPSAALHSLEKELNSKMKGHAH